ncbi:MAG: 4Fe-4S binding protein [Candidatus Sericytochromatia bacterium]|nr:4Fe-4S binding protein [Candidatus Tanganyikabacteria bacterium]
MANLAVDVLGMRFRNPVIPAAGPQVGSGAHLRAAAAGGAGGLLAKTVSSVAAPVPKPNMFQYTKTGMLNTELWSELPPERWFESEYDIGLAAAREAGIPFIASVGYSPEELRALGPRIAAKGVDAIEFTVHYLDPERIVETARALRDSVSVPIIAKLSPHSGDLGDLAAALEPHVDAFACINSFGPTLAIDIENAAPVLGSEFGYGWISGAPIKPLAVRCVFEVARRVSKPVIGVGGVTHGRDVIEMFMAGASLVGICTIVMYRGHKVYGTIADQAAKWLDDHGISDIREIQGAYVRKYGRGQRVVIEKEESPTVLADKCIKCAQCEVVCFYGAITAPVKHLAEVDPDPCFQCGLCASVCPTDALAFAPRDRVTMRDPVLAGREG